MNGREIEFRVGNGNGRIRLRLPEALILMSASDFRKIIKWASMSIYYTDNKLAVKDFFSSIPEILEDLKDDKNRSETEKAEGICNPRVDSNGKRITDKEVIEMRKARNKKLTETARKAKIRYDRFCKKVPKLEALKDMYMDWDL
jgi:hypothetical protein